MVKACVEWTYRSAYVHGISMEHFEMRDLDHLRNI